LSKLLDKDANRRVSCAEALRHPWITGNADAAKENLSASQKEDFMKNMKKFSGANKFTKSITSLLVGLTADKNDL
jgi:serine/threonine protein kinase